MFDVSRLKQKYNPNSPVRSAHVAGAEVLYWDPRADVTRGVGPVRLRLGKRRQNFGDLLGPAVVSALTPVGFELGALSASRRLVTVGSIMHFVREGDLVWGTGVNGFAIGEPHTVKADFRAVRGPESAQVMRSQGADIPDVYGDPGILVGRAFPDLKSVKLDKEVSLVAHMNDIDALRDDANSLGMNLVHPCQPLMTVLRSIAASETVVSTSLHGVIVAEALGKRVIWLSSSTEPEFKYRDYFLGTDRQVPRPVLSLDHIHRAEPLPPVDADTIGKRLETALYL